MRPSGQGACGRPDLHSTASKVAAPLVQLVASPLLLTRPAGAPGAEPGCQGRERGESPGTHRRQGAPRRHTGWPAPTGWWDGAGLASARSRSPLRCGTPPPRCRRRTAATSTPRLRKLRKQRLAAPRETQWRHWRQRTPRPGPPGRVRLGRAPSSPEPGARGRRGQRGMLPSTKPSSPGWGPGEESGAAPPGHQSCHRVRALR
mmetsp:Transcript_134483/g.287726  ORF Transcript_134483/g.287726 Transcript_134483/m.287726 type:complete len:203 (-) Transcript_134483:142-750(-)